MLRRLLPYCPQLVLVNLTPCRTTVFAGLVVAGLQLAAAGLSAQVIVYGNVYDEKDLPVQGVSVVSSRSGQGVATDLYGSYSLKLYAGDTVEYSILGYRKAYFPVTGSGTARNDVHLFPDHLSLDQVKVIARRNSVKDSLEMRREYGHIFDYRPPGVLDYGAMALSSPITFLGKLFDFKGRKRNKGFRKTLLFHEQMRFIESRIPFSLVSELTGLTGDELGLFYNTYLRDYEFVKYASQYDIHRKILQSYREYLEAEEKK